MSQLDLEICMSNLDFLVSTNEKLMTDSDFDAGNIVGLCEHYRNMACGGYLLTMNEFEFDKRLSNSVNTYIKTLKEGKHDPYYFCRSRSFQVIDAIVLMDFESLSYIDKVLAEEPNLLFEYEEDFYFMFLLAKLSLTNISEKYFLDKLDYYESLVGDDSPQFMLINALVTKNESLFYQAFGELIAEWSEDIEKRRQNESIDPYFDLTAANIYLLGIAMVNLALYFGMSVGEKLRCVPAGLVQKTI